MRLDFMDEPCGGPLPCARQASPKNERKRPWLPPACEVVSPPVALEVDSARPVRKPPDGIAPEFALAPAILNGQAQQNWPAAFARGARPGVNDAFSTSRRLGLLIDKLSSAQSGPTAVAPTHLHSHAGSLSGLGLGITSGTLYMTARGCDRRHCGPSLRRRRRCVRTGRPPVLRRPAASDEAARLRQVRPLGAPSRRFHLQGLPSALFFMAAGGRPAWNHLALRADGFGKVLYSNLDWISVTVCGFEGECPLMEFFDVSLALRKGVPLAHEFRCPALLGFTVLVDIATL
jgi:hypothetical protein